MADRPVLDAKEVESQDVEITAEMVLAGAEGLDEERLIDAVVVVLMDHFSDLSVDGLVVREPQARLIGAEVLRRYAAQV